MSKMIVHTVHRTGTAASRVRRLVVTQYTDKGRTERLLSTPIHKVEWAPEFRGGAFARPIEQYAFQVGKKTVERFADAAALVLRKHNVEIDDDGQDGTSHQKYIQNALKILAGDAEISYVDEDQVEKIKAA